MSKHTPGPWVGHLHFQVQGEFEIPHFSIFTDDGRGNGVPIPCSEDAKYETEREEAEANRCLISAAPDLLAALKRMEEADRKQMAGEEYDFSNAVLEARAAIAKAEGR